MEADFPDEAMVPLYKGQVLLELQKFDEAESMFKRSMELDPSNPLAVINLGLMEMQLKGTTVRSYWLHWLCIISV